MGLYNLKSQELLQYYVAPNLQVVTPATEQDVTRLATSPLDRHSAHPELEALKKRGKLTWRDVVTAQTLLSQNSRERLAEKLNVKPSELNVSNVKWSAVLNELERTNSFLHGTVTGGDFHYFSGDDPVPDEKLAATLRSKGGQVQRLKSFDAAIEDILAHDSHFTRGLKGKAIWIANADFESKQLGAQIAAQEASLREIARSEGWNNQRLHKELRQVNALRGIVQGTSATTSDALYSTGEKFNRVRTTARMTGDWSPVFRSILETTKPGDVRDIIDVVRAQQSFSQKLGLLEGTRPANLSMDVQARLYAFSKATTGDEEIKALRMVESHIAREDIAITERLVLQEGLEQTHALEQVHKGTPEGKRLLEEARQNKRGPLYRALRKAAVEREFSAQLGEKGFGERIARMYQDFARDSKTVQTAGYTRKQRLQFKPDGSPLHVMTPMPIRREIHDIDEAIRHISNDPTYANVNKERVLKNLNQSLVEQGAIDDIEGNVRIKSKERLERAASMLYEDSRRSTDRIFNSATSPNNGILDRLARDISPPRELSQRFSPRLSEGLKMKSIKYFGLFAAGMTAAGAFKAVADGPRRQREGPESLRTMNYAKWLEMQSAFSGMQNQHMQRSKERPNIWELTGLSKGGMGAAFRKQATDFGSPYQGPVYSGGVFQQLDLLNEREKYLRSAYGITHRDPARAVGRLLHNSIYNKGGDAYEHPLHYAQDLLMGGAASGINHNFIPGSALTEVNGAQFAGLRAKNFLQLDLNSGNWKVDVQDADTIVVKRGGVVGALQTFFGANRGYSFRLSGIDAPETEHAGGSGYHRAQPYAYAATEAAKQMVENARNLKLVIDPKNITYGRMVGTVFADGRNLNLEFIKRGMASFLPFKKAGTQEMYNAASYEAASNLARASDRGMWGTPFFQVYADFVEQSGQTITFNTLTQIDKLAKSSSLMSLASMMHNAENMGFHNSASQMEVAELAERIKHRGKKVNGKAMYLGTAEYTSDAWRHIHNFQAPTAPHKSYISEMTADLAGLVGKHGKIEANSYSARRIGGLDKNLAIDATQASRIESRRSLHLNKVLGGTRIVDQAFRTTQTQDVARQIRADRRRHQMAAAQVAQNHAMFNSPINHHRM